MTSDAVLLGDDLQQLIDSKFCFDTGLDPETFERSVAGNFCYVKLFSAIETRNGVQRRRVISWPPSMNVAEQELIQGLLQQHARVPFYSAAQVRDRGVKLQYAASLDFKKFYQQFELLVKEFWAFKYKGRVYILATFPTGAVLPPFIAQALSRTILATAVRSTDVASMVEHDSCIDNLRLNSDNLNALWAAWHELLMICKHLNITIGELNPPPLTSPNPYTYLGMLFTVSEGIPWVQLALKSKKKLTEAASIITSGVPMLVVDVIAIFGQTVWACTVTDFSLGKMYHVIKFVRRISRLPMDESITIWPSIVEHWSSTLLMLTTLTFRFAPNSTSKATMYCDACETGWGVVILDFGDKPIRIFAGRWSSKEKKLSINMLELKAFQIGIRILGALKSKEDILALGNTINRQRPAGRLRGQERFQHRSSTVDWRAAVQIFRRSRPNLVVLAVPPLVRNLASGFFTATHRPTFSLAAGDPAR